jgi:hypothetical protein
MGPARAPRDYEAQLAPVKPLTLLTLNNIMALKYLIDNRRQDDCHNLMIVTWENLSSVGQHVLRVGRVSCASASLRFISPAAVRASRDDRLGRSMLVIVDLVARGRHAAMRLDDISLGWRSDPRF